MPLFATEWRLDTTADPVTLTLRTPDGDVVYQPDPNGPGWQPMCGNRMTLLSSPGDCSVAPCVCLGPSDCGQDFLWWGDTPGCPVPVCPYPKRVSVDLTGLFGLQKILYDVGTCDLWQQDGGAGIPENPIRVVDANGKLFPFSGDPWGDAPQRNQLPDRVELDMSEPNCPSDGAITLITSGNTGWDLYAMTITDCSVILRVQFAPTFVLGTIGASIRFTGTRQTGQTSFNLTHDPWVPNGGNGCHFDYQGGNVDRQSDSFLENVPATVNVQVVSPI